MSLYPAYLQLIKRSGEATAIRHNCNGGVQFACYSEISDETAHLIELAIEEGKRIRSREFGALLNDNGSK